MLRKIIHIQASFVESLCSFDCSDEMCGYVHSHKAENITFRKIRLISYGGTILRLTEPQVGTQNIIQWIPYGFNLT